ncbi:unnamed protein product [Pedinophyceae sp. YPF-701]|nr:unnamed protein product [Pedinophyceae sp. YPF-701]
MSCFCFLGRRNVRNNVRDDLETGSLKQYSRGQVSSEGKLDPCASADTAVNRPHESESDTTAHCESLRGFTHLQTVPFTFFNASGERDAEARGLKWQIVSPWCPEELARPSWHASQLQPLECIGRGASSGVWKARDTVSGQIFAVKAYKLSSMASNAQMLLPSEAAIHASLPPHRNVLQLYAAFMDSVACYFILEYAEADLHRMHDRLPWLQAREERRLARDVLLPLLSGLAHCHSHGIIHRDIKPENLVFGTDGRLKLCDFGFAIDLARHRPTTRLGTLEFMAPEVLTSGNRRDGTVAPRRQRRPYTSAADVWSVGVLAYEMLVGQSPFLRDDVSQTCTAITRADSMPHRPTDISASLAARSFVADCLRRDAARRPSVSDLLKYEWLTKSASRGGGKAWLPSALLGSRSSDWRALAQAEDARAGNRRPESRRQTRVTSQI